MHSRFTSIAVIAASALLVQGCSLIPNQKFDPHPTAPELSKSSFAQVVAAESEKRCKTAGPSCSDPSGNLNDVRAAVGNLFGQTRTITDYKNTQQWVYSDLAASGGFAAVLGQVAKKRGLLNTGIVVALLGLSLEAIYKPDDTKKISLKAEQTFQCFQRELYQVTESDRLKALAAPIDAPGSDEASHAVRIAIEQMDDATATYRTALLNQNASVPTNADFTSFAKRYAKAASDSASAATQSDSALRVASASLATAGISATTKMQALGASSLDDASVKTTREGQTYDSAKTAFTEAEAKVAAAKFVGFDTKLEKCVKLQ